MKNCVHEHGERVNDDARTCTSVGQCFVVVHTDAHVPAIIMAHMLRVHTTLLKGNIAKKGEEAMCE